MNPNRRQMLKAAGAWIAASAVAPMARAAASGNRPNIIMLVADDHRGDALGFLGHPDVKTPNLDALAARGTAFPRACNMGSNNGAVCIAARAMIHTGRNLYRAPEDMAGMVTLGQAMRGAGYDSYAVGKWHNGTPSFARSFNGGSTIFFGGMTNNHLQCPVRDYDPEGKYPPQRIHPAGKFDAEAFADAAVAFLKGRADGNRVKPFFLYTAFTTPHDPRTPPKEYADLYDPAKITLPANFLPRHPFDNGEMSVRDEKLLPRPLTPQMIRNELRLYYGLITHLDAQVGRILTALKESQENNTIVIFTADHGLSIGSHGLLGKQNLYQPSLRTPLIFAGPGIPAGKRRNAIVLKQDYFSTLCEMTGIPVPKTVQGQSFAGMFADATSAGREGMLSGYKNFQRAYSDGRWKYIRYQVDGKKTIQLFDLQTDPAETTNLAANAAHAPQIERLAGLMRSRQKSLGDIADFSS